MARDIEVDTTAIVSLDDFDDEVIKEEAWRRGLAADIDQAELLDALKEADAPEWVVWGISDWLAQPSSAIVPKSSLAASLMRAKNVSVR